MGDPRVLLSSPSSTMVLLGSRSILVYTFAISAFLMSAEGGVFIPILQQEQDINPIDGTYRYSYGTANGIVVSEQGRLEHLGPDKVANTVDGTYTYLNSDGTLVNVKYVADERGFRAVPNVVYRPQVVAKVASPGGQVYFENYNSLRQALRL